MKRVAGLLILVLVVLGAYVAWALWLPYAGFSEPRMVDIAPHSRSRVIARQLERAGVIRSATAFELWRLMHPSAVLKAGTYRFTSAAAATTVFNRLQRGDVFFYVLTVPEGYNRFDIAGAIERAGIASSAQFLDATTHVEPIRDIDPRATTLEGFLFPDTYRISPHETVAQIAAGMVTRFRQQLSQQGGVPLALRLTQTNDGEAVLLDNGQSLPLHDWVTMASLVEKESASPDERPVIAGVFYNRLRRSVPLQCDPTVIYAAESENRYTGSIHKADLRFSSPYNTYLHAGLPPGPIANPGRQSLFAAAHPVQTDYLYFVSTGHGSHRFARTLAEHDRNVAAYLRDQRQNR